MDLTERLARFAPITLTADRSRLGERQQTMAEHLIAAGRKIGGIYRRQIWSGNADLRARLAASDDPQDRLRLRLFDLMGGPWDIFDEGHPFIGENRRPQGGDFYPEDLTREEFESWLEEHPEDRPAFTGYFSVIRRHGEDLKAIPFHRAYRPWLEPAAEALQKAARLSDHAPLSDYLNLRAEALLNDDYFDSDCAWVALQDGPIEVAIGPYELYEDHLFGYKAAYQCMVGVRDLEESARFRSLVDQLPTMAAHLPVPPAYRGKVTGLASPIVVADTVYNSGLLATVAIPIAFVLPNDPRTRLAVGTKKVMLKNIIRAKFDQIVVPIAEDALDPDQAAAVSFEGYFALVLLHEISHALGLREVPGPDGTRQPLHQVLRDLFSPIEECKAEVVGLYNVLFLAEEGVFPQEWQESAPGAFLASILRMTRMGTGGAHARGDLLAFNFLREAGAIRWDRQTGRLWADARKTAPAIAKLAGILLRLGGDGNYAGAQALLRQYGQVPPELQKALDLVRGELPLDLAPTYPWAAQASRRPVPTAP